MATKKAATARPAKKAGAQKGTAEKTSSKESATQSHDSTSATDSNRRGTDAPRADSKPSRDGSMTGTRAAAEAARQLLELTGREAEGVTGLSRVDDGWRVQVEVVEVRRIPDTTDVLALYEVDVDGEGQLLGYRRLRRYARGVPGEC